MPRGTYFEHFQEHTLLKHFLLEAYLKQWAVILLRGGFPRVWFVDAFAGAGCDLDGRPGSPLIAARIAEAVNAELYPGEVTADRGMHVLAIEQEREWYECLEEQLREFTQRRPQFVYVRPGTLEDRLEAFQGRRVRES